MKVIEKSDGTYIYPFVSQDAQDAEGIGAIVVLLEGHIRFQMGGLDRLTMDTPHAQELAEAVLKAVEIAQKRVN